MDQSAIPVRYARALFDLSIEQNIEQEIYENMVFINKITASNARFLLLLSSRAISQTEKFDVINRIIEPYVNKLTYKFLNYVIKKRREEYLTRMALEYMKCHNQKHNIIQVTIKSTHTLTNEQTDKIKNIISAQTGKTPSITTITDSALIGGYQIVIEDRFYDLSVKGMLNKIEKSF